MATVHQALIGATIVCCLGSAPMDAKAAANLGIEPLRLELSPTRKSSSFRLFNKGDAPVLVQVDAVSWAQVEGSDMLAVTQTLMVSPPLFRIAPKGVQTIRVGYTVKPDAMRETTYRVLIREVAERQPEMTGVATVIQLSLPIFVAPAQPAKPALAWRLMRTADGKLQLTAHNQGTSHAQIAEVKLVPPLLGPNTTPGGYLLHGQSRSWEWASKEAQPTGVKISYRMNGLPVEAAVTVGN